MQGTGDRDAQLDWVIGVAQATGIPLWLEAGTLLGIAREGRPLQHDKDLDLALWAEHSDKLERLAQHARAAGYRVYTETHRETLHKMKLFPPGRGARIIDLQVYRRTATHAWSPVRSVPQYTYRWWMMHRVARAAVRWPLRWWWQEHARSVEISKWPWRAMARLWTWWVPLDLVATTTLHPGTGYPVPVRWEEYLTHRYGTWRIPDPAWNTEKQDPVLRKEPPEAVVGATLGNEPIQAV